MCHHGCPGGGPLDPWTDRDDLACGLDAEGQGRDPSDVPAAGANELFPVPDAGSLDLDQHLPGFQRRRLRQLEKRHVVAERLDADGSQAHARIIPQSGPPRPARAITSVASIRAVATGAIPDRFLESASANTAASVPP